jgi:hypothetical protein
VYTVARGKAFMVTMPYADPEGLEKKKSELKDMKKKKGERNRGNGLPWPW